MVAWTLIVLVVGGGILMALFNIIGDALEARGKKQLTASKTQALDYRWRNEELERQNQQYEDFLMRLGADDVGNPQLEARLLLSEVRSK